MFDIETFARQVAIIAIPALIAITFHEAAHGLAAWRLGDPTAKLRGRLTLNPLRHIDPVGTILFPLLLVLMKSPFVFGWAKPVPVDPRYFANPMRGMMLVSLAGPGINFALALGFAALYHALLWLVLLLDGAWVGALMLLVHIAQYGVLFNLVLGIFNLFPIPPLDGSKILAGFLPYKGAAFIYGLERYGFVLIIILLLTGVLQDILLPLVSASLSLLGLMR
jgi:Zn-dependent protease